MNPALDSALQPGNKLPLYYGMSLRDKRSNAKFRMQSLKNTLFFILHFELGTVLKSPIGTTYNNPSSMSS